jgi:hypothetical protein
MKSSKLRAAGVATLVAVAGAAAVPTSEAQYNNPPSPITIKMDAKGKKFRFVGPSKVEKGAKITFVNKDNPRKLGPHTASVVDPDLVPRGKAEIKECENLGGVCGAIARAHKVKFPEDGPPTIGKPDVDAGKKGWDKAFGKKGDTWYTETKGEKETRKLRARGSTITFFCAVHPTMSKTLKIVE